jgi:orotidine-5'-phosphate decarboxylase
MRNFADRLIENIRSKGNPCVVGLDPRIELMPSFIIRKARKLHTGADRIARFCIAEYHRRLVRLIADLVPAVKPQIAFFEQYGIAGMLAFKDTIEEAKRAGLLVIADVKRNDISSTAQAYANAFLGRTRFDGADLESFDADCITVAPYLGGDSLEPFVRTCREYGKGIFVLVKTSNPGSADLQNLEVEVEGRRTPLYARVAELVEKSARDLVGDHGYSSIGAVVGATFPAEAQILRNLMDKSIFLVPGYGAQGGTARNAALCFNRDGLGAVVNSSRAITYNLEDLDLGEAEFETLIQLRVGKMINEINGAVDAVSQGFKASETAWGFSATRAGGRSNPSPPRCAEGVTRGSGVEQKDD